MEKCITFVSKYVADREVCDKFMLELIEAELDKYGSGSGVREPYAPPINIKLSKEALKGYEYTA